MATHKSGPGKLARMQNSLRTQRMKKREATAEAIDTGVSLLTGAGLGYARGKWGKDGEWNIWDGKINIPWEVAIGVGAGVAGFMGVGGTQRGRVLEVGKTSLAVFLNRWAEKEAKESE